MMHRPITILHLAPPSRRVVPGHIRLPAAGPAEVRAALQPILLRVQAQGGTVRNLLIQVQGV